jgi:hypothetical protein
MALSTDNEDNNNNILPSVPNLVTPTHVFQLQQLQLTPLFVGENIKRYKKNQQNLFMNYIELNKSNQQKSEQAREKETAATRD